MNIHSFVNSDRSILEVYYHKPNKVWLWMVVLNSTNMCYILGQAIYIRCLFNNLHQGNHYHICLHDGISMRNWCSIDARYLLRQLTTRNVTSIMRIWTFGIPHICNSSRPLRWFQMGDIFRLTWLLTVVNSFPTLLIDRYQAGYTAINC